MEASNLEAVVAGGRDGFGGKLIVGACVVDSCTFDNDYISRVNGARPPHERTFPFS